MLFDDVSSLFRKAKTVINEIVSVSHDLKTAENHLELNVCTLYFSAYTPV